MFTSVGLSFGAVCGDLVPACRKHQRHQQSPGAKTMTQAHDPKKVYCFNDWASWCLKLLASCEMNRIGMRWVLISLNVTECHPISMNLIDPSLFTSGLFYLLLIWLWFVKLQSVPGIELNFITNAQHSTSLDWILTTFLDSDRFRSTLIELHWV